MTHSVDFLLAVYVALILLGPLAVWMEKQFGARISRFLRMGE